LTTTTKTTTTTVRPSSTVVRPTTTTTRPTTRRSAPVNTGDESKTMLWALVMAVAAGALGVLFFLRREQE
ncbi:MAG: LPXTG cell wall anchor domain-containing protein, partial [Clostridia bacterium]|nr:LPXTG cell wall anchor domain-containing protein [Clostridia bacterium]